MQFYIVEADLSRPLTEALQFQCSSDLIKFEILKLKSELIQENIEIFAEFDNILVTEVGYKVILMQEYVESRSELIAVG